MLGTHPAKKTMDFPKAASLALTRIEPREEKRSALLDRIIALESQGGSTTKAEAVSLVETLGKLVSEIQEGGARDRCLCILAEVCREHLILPKSYIVSDLDLGEVWRFGGVADIFTGKLGQKDVCVKVFRQHEDVDQQKFKGAFYYRAVRWKHISHPNLHRFLGVSEAVLPFGLVTPRMSSNIKEYTKQYQDANRPLLLTNAACGLEYLHSLDIVHGGINPGNILITGQNAACIGDFGIAEIVTDPLVAGQCCTMICRRDLVRYMAPEQLENSVISKESDVHSFAITAYEVLVGIQPYPGVTGEGPLVVRIMGGTRPFRPENEAAARWLSDDIWRMLETCWAPKPSTRPTIGKVHQAVQGLDATVGSPAPRGKTFRGVAPSDPLRIGMALSAKYRFVGFFRALGRFRKILRNKRTGSAV